MKMSVDYKKAWSEHVLPNKFLTLYKSWFILDIKKNCNNL